MPETRELTQQLGWLHKSGIRPASRALREPRRGEWHGRPRPAVIPEFDEDLARRAIAALEPWFRWYFRAEVRGIDHIPDQQTLIIANHDGGMLPLDGPLLLSAWYRHMGFDRRVHVLVHDMVLRCLGPWKGAARRMGCVLADRPNLDAVLDSGHSVLLYPGGSRETFRSFWERKTLTLGNRTGFVRHALRRRVLLTPVVSVGVHETFFVLSRGGWLAEKLGITRRFRADVFPLVAGLPFGIWLGAGFPQLPLPAKLTVQILPPIDLYREVTERLGRDLRPADLDDELILRRGFERVRSAMQRQMDLMYAERKLPVIG